MPPRLSDVDDDVRRAVLHPPAQVVQVRLVAFAQMLLFGPDAVAGDDDLDVAEVVADRGDGLLDDAATGRW